MKIVFLCKRRPMGRDLITRPYGRFYNLPHLLSQRGHEVYIVLLSYKREPSVWTEREGITWVSENIYSGGPCRYLATSNSLLHDLKPDWVVGFSDTYYGILAVILGEKHGARTVIDAYDNYESYFPSWFKPLHMYWRRAISRATVVTAAGPHLGQYLGRFRNDKKVHIIPMAADPNISKRIDRIKCRQKLGLPLGKKLIGNCGSIHKKKGIDILFRAFEKLSIDNSDIEFVLAGRKQKNINLPAKVRWLGYLPDDDVVYLLNSFDVFVVVNKISKFGKYSYPIKLYEAMKCCIPVVATDTPPTRWILRGDKQFLTPPRDEVQLAEKIKKLLHLGRYDYGQQNTWEHSCNLFEEVLMNGM